MIWSWPENKLFVHIPLQNRVCFWSAASSQWTDGAWELQYKASTFFGQLHTNLGSGQAVLHVVVLVVLECTLTSRNRQIVWLFLPKCFLLGHFLAHCIDTDALTSSYFHVIGVISLSLSLLSALWRIFELSYLCLLPNSLDWSWRPAISLALSCIN